MSANIALYCLAGLNMAFCVLSQVALWQRKEYRIDRMRAYMYSPEKSVFHIAVWMVSLLCMLTAFVVPLFGYISLLVLLAGYVVRAMKRGVARPKFTMRAIAVCALAIMVSVAPLFFISNILWISLIVVLLPLIVTASVWAIAIPSALKKSATIQKAITYRSSLAQLQVIGITGSVGKTSTKTYALHLLQNTIGDVVATYAHRNSPYVVAIDMLGRVLGNTKTYIVEMGAYKMGEIKEICDIVQPDIAVITAITNQHVALFGSLEKLAQAKWELATAITKDGVLILNKDDDTIRAKASNSNQRIIWYSLKGNADVMLTNIVLHDDSTKCDLVLGKEIVPITIPVISRGQLGSVLAACAVAFVAGVDSQVLIARLVTLPAIEKTMEYKKLQNDAVVIDDSYSASEASVMNAIEYLNAVGGEHALLVLVPIIELGNEASAVHQRIGAALAHATFQAFIYGTAYQDAIMGGLAGTPHPHITWYEDPHMLAKDVLKYSEKKSVIMFEGRLPSVVTGL